MNCPRCGVAAKETQKTWNYGSFNVRQSWCSECERYFNAYYIHNKLSHTIPKIKTKK